MEIIIIGAGKLGTGLAGRLLDEDHNITVVDINQSRIDKLIETLDVQAICGSGTHIDILLQAGVEKSDLVIATTMSDENNILACLISKKLGAVNTIARVRNPEYSQQFDFMRNELGVTMMVNPDHAAALEISRILKFPYASNIETFARGTIDMVEMQILENSPLAGLKVSEVSTKHKIRMIICAVERDNDVYIPNGDFVIQSGDKIHFTGEHKGLTGITKILTRTKIKPLKNIMIIGSSRASIYLSQILISHGKNVVIVDNDRAKCKETLNLVPQATIVNGDSNDHEMLVENGIKGMDAVITLTNTDEINFLVSLYAKNIGVGKTITKINNINFQKMLDDLGIGSRINISEITIDMITKYVRAKKNVSSSYMRTLYKLVNGKVEAIEFTASEHTLFLNRPLSEIQLNNNILIAAIKRNNKTIFPSGNDSIQMGDIVIVVAKEKKISSLNDIIQ